MKQTAVYSILTGSGSSGHRCCSSSCATFDDFTSTARATERHTQRERERERETPCSRPPALLSRSLLEEHQYRANGLIVLSDVSQQQQQQQLCASNGFAIATHAELRC